MADLTGFDANNVDPMKAFEPLPIGRYSVWITDTDERPTKKGDGKYIQFTFEVTEGRYTGRLLWTNLNLDNPNPKAVEMAKAELSSICRAVKVPKPGDTTELHHLPLVVAVKIKTRKDTGEPSNEIAAYYPKDSGSQTTPPTPASEVAPWARP